MHIFDVSEVRNMYTGGKSLIEIGRFFGVSQQTIKRRLTKIGITLRNYTSNQFGSRNHQWKGGESRSTINRTAKQIVLEASISLNTCQKCGQEFQYNLNRHHIDGNRTNNNSSNIRVLCVKCHNSGWFGAEHTKERDELGRFKNGEAC